MAILFENWPAKLLSVAVALLLWVALVDEPELIETVSVPVEYRNLDSTLDLSPEAPTRVQIQVRGPRSRLGAVSSENTNIVFDLGAMRQPSARTFTITKDLINLPNRVSLVRAMPSQMRVTLERRLMRDVPVTVAITPAPSVRVIATEVTPPTVRIAGPESSVRAAASLPTEPIDLATVDAAKPLRLNVLLADPELSVVGSAFVTVKLSIEKIP
jgi:YbbR domain-containing protein